MSRGDEKPRQTAVAKAIKTVRKFFKNPLTATKKSAIINLSKVRKVKEVKTKKLKKVKKVLDKTKTL